MEYIGKFKRIQLYINNQLKSMEEVKAEVGCDLIINGGLFNMANFSPVCCLKHNGTILVDDGYKYWGYGWNDGSKIDITNDMNKYNNYICCVCMVKDGKEEKMYLASSLKGSRQRTAIGRFSDGRIWVFAQQSPAMSPEALQAYAKKIGVQDAIMLDGGASTQCLSEFDLLSSTRIVHNFVCIWFENDKKFNYVFKPITKADGWKNAELPSPKGIVLHSTATPSANATTMQKAYNKPSVGASVHAFVDNEGVVQCLPWRKKAGHIGSGSKGSYNNTHIGIEMCEPSGLTYNGSKSAIVKYNPPANYFKKTWENTVNLFAYLCKQFNLNPLDKTVIVSHTEANKLGYGSNHADPEHWIQFENKTMDDFRHDVDIALKKLNNIIVEEPLVEFSEFSYEHWKAYMERYLKENAK